MADEEPIKVNDEVYWNHEHPAMLVDEIIENGYAICTWTERPKGRREVRREQFKLSQLSRTPPPPSFSSSVSVSAW